MLPHEAGMGGSVDRRTFNKLASLAGVGALTGSSGTSVFGPDTYAEGEKQSTSAASAVKNQAPWDRYFVGTAYYPEWWQRSEWETDFRQMQELGISAVRMGEFAWAIYEPAPEKFQFDWMDHAIALANRHGVDVILGTPTASVPPWLYQLHPDVLSGNERGPYTYGGRKGYCTSSPNYQRACERIVTALAEHYGHHPGVIGWQLDNEPGYPFQSFDPDSERAFQIWLQKRYGSLGALNREWNGAFWSNKYSDWPQIHFPTNSAEGGWQPAITLAYRRFFSDSFLNHLRRQAIILRKAIQGQFIATNWPAPAWSVDVFTAAAEFLDATAWDNYVVAPAIGNFQHQYIAGFNHDFSRCAGPRQRFFCAEQMAYVPANAPEKGLRLQAYINLAHGSHGHLYFEWRRPLAGNEQYRPSFIKSFDGSIEAKPTYKQITKEFARLGPRLARATTHADIALLFNFSNEWSQGFGSIGRPKGRHYGGEEMHYYSGFKTLQRNLDVVPLERDLSEYKLILAPNLHLVDEATVARLNDFVLRGGILLLNYRAGTQKMDVSMRRVLPPGLFGEMAGVIAEANEVDFIEYPILNTEGFGISFLGSNTIFRPHTILESLTLRGAEPVAAFHGGRMAGRPAVTRNRHGKGWVFYVGTDCADDGFYETLARAVADTGNLSPLLAAPFGVEVVSRENAESIFYFLLNLTETTHNDIELPKPMHDLIADQSGQKKISLGPLEVAVLESPKGENTSR
ncbi:MAG: beta-galactosidase [Acidobacteriaceae bacterium]